MRVAREFHRPEVVAWLETVDENQLADLAAHAASAGLELTEEQREGVRQARESLDAGHFVEHEKMLAWLGSLGTDHELPKPKCQCGCE